MQPRERRETGRAGSVPLPARSDHRHEDPPRGAGERGRNPYYQFFCGEEFFQHRLVFDRSSLTRWRNRMGEERLQALLQESLSVATRTKAIKPSELSRVIVDTTVQPKNVMFPTDARLLNGRARNWCGWRSCAGWFTPILCAGGQVRPDPAPALCPCQAVQARQPDAEACAPCSAGVIRDISRKIEGDERARRRVRPAADAGAARARATATSARTQALFPACPGSRMHRQGQGPPALRVRRQGLDRHHQPAHAKAASSSPTSRRCRAIPMTVTRWPAVIPETEGWSATPSIGPRR